MNKQEVYVNLRDRLSRLDLSCYWPGFKAYPFALYDSKSVYFEGGEVPWDSRFIGNTSIEFEGRRIAIWNIEDEEPDMDCMAADMVHEMFHCFQFENGEKRFPQDLKMLCCPWDADYFGLKQAENRILAQSVILPPEEKKEALREFFGIRRLRSGLSDVLWQELLAETGEGMAEFAGCQALMELAPEKFEKRIRGYCRKTGEYSEDLFDLRRGCYYSGTLLMFTAADAGYDFRHEVGKTKKTVSELIEEISGSEIPDEVTCDLRVRLGMDVFYRKKHEEIENFSQNAEEAVNGNWYISGYDPMNMTRIDDFIYSTNFLRLTDCETGSSFDLFGRSLLHMKKGSHDLVTEYMK